VLSIEDYRVLIAGRASGSRRCSAGASREPALARQITAAELAAARKLSSDDHYSSIARLTAVTDLGVPTVRCSVRNHVFRRPAQGRHAGEIAAAESFT
jgi:hypothetical protein